MTLEFEIISCYRRGETKRGISRKCISQVKSEPFRNLKLSHCHL